MMNIVVFGANGPTGRLLTKQAVAEGHAVTAVTRHPETFPLRNARLQVMHGDVFDLSSVEQAVAGQDAVLSTLGVPFSRKAITLYSQGTAHIVQAMNHYGVRRLVCVSSSATDPHHDTGGGFVFDKILQPIIISTIGRTLYADMKRMETLVMNSHLDWIIVRPLVSLRRQQSLTIKWLKRAYADNLPPGQIWRTACSNNSPMTSICTRLWRWQLFRCSPTCFSFLGERRSSAGLTS